MNQLYEKSKFIFLIAFVLLSILQVGILWDYRNQGLPISFLKSVVTRSAAYTSFDVKELLKPSRIVVSSGYDEPHIVYEPYDTMFLKIWQEARLYLRDTMIERNLISSVNYSDDEWGNLAVKKGIIFNFNTKIDAKLLHSLLGLENINEVQFARLYKMAIGFDEIINNKMAIYVTDGEKIFKYELKPHQNNVDGASNGIVLPDTKSDQDMGYKLLKEIFPKKDKAPWNFRPEISIYIADKYVDYNDLEVSMPDWMTASPLDDWKDLSVVSKAILGIDKDSYDADIDDNGNIIFANINNIYRLNKQGILEYMYLSDQGQKIKPDINTCFEKAIDFINTKNDLVSIRKSDYDQKNDILNPKNDQNSIQNLYLSNVEYDLKNQKYIFDFNYSLGEVPVIFIDDDATRNNSYAIRVEVNSSRVINCTMVIRKIKYKSTINAYNIRFTDFSTELYKKFGNAGLKQISMEDIFVGFALNRKSLQVATPSWIIRSSESKYYSLILNQKKGD